MIGLSGKYFLRNGEIELSEQFPVLCSNIKFEVYEVIRIIKGIPLFCEDHFSRMTSSLNLLHKNSPIDFSNFEKQIKLLIEKNEVKNGNLKVSIGEQTENIVIQFIPHHYPAPNDYFSGVKTGLYIAERNNPNIKANQLSLKEKVTDYLKESGFYEVFYVDRNDTITEGSRSNVFFVRGTTVYTCLAEKVLLGITRQKVIECLNNKNIELIETNILKDEIQSFDSVFLTGTSPKILPIASIDETNYSCANATTDRIRNEYNRMIDQYIESKLSESD